MGYRVMQAGVVVALVLLLAACGSTGGSTAFSYGGNWVGTMNDSFAGSGTMTATMAQSGSNLVGTWQATFAEGGNGGNLIGVIEGNQVILQMNPSDPTTCPFEAVATRSGSTLSGTYAAFNCTAVITGTVSVTKQ